MFMDFDQGNAEDVTVEYEHALAGSQKKVHEAWPAADAQRRRLPATFGIGIDRSEPWENLSIEIVDRRQ